MSKSPFFNQISRFMRLNGYSFRTEKTDIQRIKCFIRFHGLKHPEQMGQMTSFDFLSIWLLTDKWLPYR